MPPLFVFFFILPALSHLPSALSSLTVSNLYFLRFRFYPPAKSSASLLPRQAGRTLLSLLPSLKEEAGSQKIWVVFQIWSLRLTVQILIYRTMYSEISGSYFIPRSHLQLYSSWQKISAYNDTTFFFKIIKIILIPWYWHWVFTLLMCLSFKTMCGRSRYLPYYLSRQGDTGCNLGVFQVKHTQQMN